MQFTLISFFVFHTDQSPDLCEPAPENQTVCVCCHLTAGDGLNNQTLFKTEAMRLSAAVIKHTRIKEKSLKCKHT